MLKNNSLLKRFRGQAAIVFQSMLLKELTHLEAYEFVQLCHRRSYEEGEYIYHFNDPGNGFYIIESGRIELLLEDDNQSNEERASIPLTAPQCFGNLSLLNEMRRMSSARTTEPTIVLGFFTPDFITLEKRYPQIALKLLKEFNRVTSMQLIATMNELSQKTSPLETYQLQFQTFYSHSDEDTI
ncbi:MAG: cyclic nucleotide-binding domain-containing protein [Balneolales bacterium]|nr:cyclic nucleotide-binding domain-containing protein [Balneolales bacterium]